MDWHARLGREGIRASFPDFALVYHASLRPAVPPEYELPGLVGLTFRLRPRSEGGFVFATVLDVAAVVRLGQRLGLDAAGALALVDSHERVHIALQLEGVPADVEEQHSLFVDGVLLSLWQARAAEHVRTGTFGLVTRVGEGLWEALLDAGGR